MLISRSLLDDLAAMLTRGPSGPAVAWVDADVDPLDLVRAGAPSFATAVYTSSPEGRRIGGLGVALKATAGGADRLSRLRPALRGLPAGLPAFVGFSYDPGGPVAPEWSEFPPAAVVVPQIAVVRESGRSRLAVAVPPGADPGAVLAAAASLRHPDRPRVPRAASVTVTSEPGVDEWRRAVAEAVEAAESGMITKVVLARSVRVGMGSPIAAFDVVALLADRYPECRVFGWQQGRSAFVGASPELLVSRRGGRFRSVALAGSAARSAAPGDDRRLADSLLASSKDRVEHAVVVEEILRRLGPLAEVVDVPPVPVVERYATVQHLSTPVVGRTAATILELAEALHPTPAVGGHPEPEALAFQAKLEQIDRGWYAGGIGWADSSGDGDVAVGLRSALIGGDGAVLYAGNGIVAGSDPDAEVEETRIKLRPLLDLLTGA